MKIQINWKWLLLLLPSFFFACQEEASVGGTPEEIVRQYQGFLDNNEFEKAKKISTPAGREILEGLSVFFAGPPDDSTIVHTEFLSITCQEEGNTARCNCQLKDEFEAYESIYILMKIGDRWLVDTNDEGITIEQSESASEEIMEESDSSSQNPAPY